MQRVIQVKTIKYVKVEAASPAWTQRASVKGKFKSERIMRVPKVASWCARGDALRARRGRRRACATVRLRFTPMPLVRN